MEKEKNKIKGGFSDEVFASGELQSYLERGRPLFGYIGAEERTKRFDKALEAMLRQEGLGYNGIGEWLTSTSGRYCADDLYRGMTDIQLEAALRGYTENAFLEVMIWNHPDHQGTLGSTKRLMETLRQKLLK